MRDVRDSSTEVSKILLNSPYLLHQQLTVQPHTRCVVQKRCMTFDKRLCQFIITYSCTVQLLDPDEESINITRNVENYTSKDTALHTARLEFSATQLREPQNRHKPQA